MKCRARIMLAILLSSGLWLALKPTIQKRRITFLPVEWSQYLDRMDFWFNLIAFALLAAAAWLAFSPERRLWRALGWITALITTGNILVEIAQTHIPGRAMDAADVVAGLIGAVLGCAGGLWLQLRCGRRDTAKTPQVLFVDQTGRLGGAELMLLDLAIARSADSEVLLYQDGEFREALEQAGVKVHVLPLGENTAAVDKQAGWLRVLRVVPQLLENVLQTALLARRFDVVYANTAKSLIIGGPAAFLAGRKLVFHLHDIISAGHFSAMNRLALVFCANRFADAVIANSEATKAAFVSAGGRVENVCVVPNGFQLTKSRSTEAEQAALRTSLGLPTHAWIVLMAGRLTPWKGQHVLLEALREVPDAHAVLLGEALFTDEDRAYAAQLRETATHPTLAGRVHFAGFRTDTQPFFDLADVIVHASVIAEPFGRVIVEGMLAGKPVIATRAGGAAEIVTHEETGLLVEPGSAAELASALRRLHENPAFALRLGDQGRETAANAYGLDAVRAKIENVILSFASPAETHAPSTLQPVEVSP